jgi:hypothetical protein
MTDHTQSTTDPQPTSTVDTTTATTPAVTTPIPTTANDLARIRELVLQAHPDVVPDLIRGDCFDDLLASIEPARTAYQRIADQLRAGAPTTASTTTPADTAPPARPPHVPAGGATTIIDPASLTPTTKIARALDERRKAGGGRREA